MKYLSTRTKAGTDEPVSIDTALVRGIAADGGLYLPEALPRLEPGDFSKEAQIGEVAQTLLAPFFASSRLLGDLDDIIAETFHFLVPVTPLKSPSGTAALLELFHGPTAAFKDFGAGFLAACLSRLEGQIDDPLTILVATSGDTGGAVAAAFDARPGMRVVVLYPDGRVSARQAHQLSCWSDNVLSLAVRGSFDECQALVKQAMGDESLANRHRFSSANSINIGRLLPQAVYYAYASLRHWQETGQKVSFIVPTGNLGNALACVLAREIGLPVGRIVLATNENRLIVDYLAGADWAPRASVQTLASAMDVGNPSNMERLRSLFGDGGDIAGKVSAVSVSDKEITREIGRNFKEFGIATCPHTATATYAWRGLSADEKKTCDWVLVATAHAAKFERIVEPVIGTSVEVPEKLAELLARPRRFVELDPGLEQLADAIDRHFQA